MLKNKRNIPNEPSVAQEQGVMVQPDEVISLQEVLASSKRKVIGREEVLKATETLQRYKEGKANLEKRIIDNEQWYKLRHWECMRKSDENEVEPTSAWLFNAIANKHADAMDNFPAPNILPREERDKADAKMLSAIIPVVLDQNDFEKNVFRVSCFDVCIDDVLMRRGKNAS